MAEQLTILGSSVYPLDGIYPREYLAAVERAIERILEPHSANTKRAYSQALRHWVAHCHAIHVQPFPIEPSHLVFYLERRSEEGAPGELAPNSVRVHLAALCAADARFRIEAGLEPLYVRGHPFVKRWVHDWARDHPRAPRVQAPAFCVRDVLSVCRAARERAPHASAPAHLTRYARDRAIILIGVVGGFRAAELAGLDLGDVRIHDRGLTVHLRKSKTDQHGKGRFVGLHPMGKLELCPVDAWQQWVRMRGEWPGAAFVSVHRDGTLSADRLGLDSIRRMVRARIEAASLKGSSHSMRATFVNLAYGHGHDLVKIANHAGHKSLDTTRGYLRQADLFADNVSAGLLDGD